MRRAAIALVVLLQLFILPPALEAQEAAPEDSEFLYVISQDLPQLLQSIAERNGMRAVLSNSVRGRVKNMRLPVRLTQLLTRLSESYDIEWFIEGDTINVSRKNELVNKVLDLKQVSFNSFEKQLRESGIDTQRIRLQKIGNGGVVSFTASPALVTRLEQLAASLASAQNGTIVMYRYGVPVPTKVASP